jgi:hypothetical protein
MSTAMMLNRDRGKQLETLFANSRLRRLKIFITDRPAVFWAQVCSLKTILIFGINIL